MSSPKADPEGNLAGNTDFKNSFRIIIIGAGLVGLGTAILLRKGGFQVTVLERDAEMREVRETQRKILIF